MRDIDKELFQFGKSLEILNIIKWPDSVQERFFSKLEQGRITLPRVIISRPDYSAKKRHLRELRKSLSGKHPLGVFLTHVTRSYEHALSMLESMGTKRFTEYSKRLYGSTLPEEDPWATDTLRLAKRFLKAFKRFDEEQLIPPESVCILPASVAHTIEQEVHRTFPDEKLRISLTDQLASKAAASARGVRIRKGTCFAPHDVMQLLNHELLVHTLTLLNGRAQPLRSFGIASPYTTTTQEGLAVFSEFVTNSIDIVRIARISARVVAIDMALRGADFVDVYRYFRSLKQSESESYFSAMRIFRGGHGRGGVVFTKDLVYIKGILQVRNFLLRALEEEKFDHCAILFSGRLTIADVELLAPLFETGELHYPKYLPDWVRNAATLLTYLLSVSAFKGLGEGKKFAVTRAPAKVRVS
ncbi:MAG: DUF1704 domain-containing protein [Bdellovibrionales bacterium]|nr:DUF1704 domain-containing protein [Bdellovibrionales bacterium]